MSMIMMLVLTWLTQCVSGCSTVKLFPPTFPTLWKYSGQPRREKRVMLPLNINIVKAFGTNCEIILQKYFTSLHSQQQCEYVSTLLQICRHWCYPLKKKSADLKEEKWHLILICIYEFIRKLVYFKNYILCWSSVYFLSGITCTSFVHF